MTSLIIALCWRAEFLWKVILSRFCLWRFYLWRFCRTLLLPPRNALWELLFRKGYILPDKSRAWSEFVKIEVGHFGFMCLSFVNMLFFANRLLLTRRCKLVEVFMTVVMNQSQRHGRRGQRIDTRHPERQIQKVSISS